jgi:ABC-type transport system involved in multi-copper enzyme maturation permease subunit
MIQTLRAEFRKMLSIRSTYFITLFAIVLVSFLSFYVSGFQDSKHMTNLFLAGTLPQVGGTISAFGGLVAILLMAHEYRYNTIVYTLTASNSRSKVLAAKIIAVFTYVFVFVAAIDALALGLMILGTKASGHTLTHQDINLGSYFLKTLVYCEGTALAGLLIVTIIRNLTASIVTLFVVPGTVESLLSLLLKNNKDYLPFTSLAEVISPPTLVAGPLPQGTFTPLHSALYFAAWLVVGWAITWFFFLRRDAN